MDCRPGLESSICPGYCYTDSVNSYTEAVTQVSYVAFCIYYFCRRLKLLGGRAGVCVCEREREGGGDGGRGKWEEHGKSIIFLSMTEKQTNSSYLSYTCICDLYFVHVSFNAYNRHELKSFDPDLVRIVTGYPLTYWITHSLVRVYY